MDEIRSRVRAFIFGVTAVIVAILVFRIGLDLMGGDASVPFLKVLFDVSDFFINPFYGLIDLNVGGVTSSLNFNAMLALGIYIISAVILVEIITGFLYDNLEDIIQNIVDGLFKLVEFVLFLRIVFELFALTSREVLPGFVNFVFGLTNWTQGFLFDIRVGDGSIDLGAIVILVLVILLDIASGRMVRSIFEYRRKSATKSASKKDEVQEAKTEQAENKKKETVSNDKEKKDNSQKPEIAEKEKSDEKPKEKYVPRTDLPEYKEYSDKTEAPEIKIVKPDAEDPDPEEADKK